MTYLGPSVYTGDDLKVAEALAASMGCDISTLDVGSLMTFYRTRPAWLQKRLRAEWLSLPPADQTHE